MTTGGGVNWVDAVVVKVLVVLLLPLLGAYLSITACVGFVHASLNVLWWSLRTKCGNRAKGKHQEGTSPALDYFWVTAWLVTYLVVTPVSLAVFFLSLGLPFLLITPQAGSMIHLVHKGLVTAFCAYCVWAYLLDNSVSKGGLTKARLRRSAPLSHIARYFGMTMTVADDDGGGAKQTSDNCIFCYHPHGILFWGVIGGFANQSWGVRWNSKTLAELDISLGTISFNNFIPFFREVNKNLGAFNVSWRGCNRALEEGRNIFIVPGGARESIHAYPGTMNVCIKQRKGFIRLALKQGKPLVPVLSFGESDMYNMLKIEQGTALYKVQRVYQSIFGFTIPIFWGRTIWGLPTVIPKKKPVHVVLGSPIQVERFSGDLHSPEGKSAVDALHMKYLKELEAMFHKHKEKWAHPKGVFNIR